MAFSQRGILIFPVDGLTTQVQTDIAQAYVDIVQLETLENEMLMFDKGAAFSADYGATETHRGIYTALTPALATAITDAMAGVTGGLWYLLDANEQLIATNDPAKLDQGEVTHGLSWHAGIAVSVNEVLRYQGSLYQCVQAHTTQSDWTPDISFALWRRYIAPGEVTVWRQPQGAHDAYPVGARVEYNNTTWINTSAANVFEPGVSGWTDENASQTDEWAVGVAYAVGDEVTYQGTTYRCLQAHTSIASWSPTSPGILGVLWQAI